MKLSRKEQKALGITGPAPKMTATIIEHHRPVVKSLILTLPYPPSVNKYWRRSGNRTHISPGGEAFRKQVAEACLEAHVGRLEGKLAIQMVLCSGDKRHRDIDNYSKATLDALQHCGVYGNDNQIVDMRVIRGPADDRHVVEVFIKSLTEEME